MAGDEGAPAAPPAAAAPDANAAAGEEAPPAFKSRSSSRGGNIRRRKAAAAATESEEEDEGVAVAKKARQETQGLRIAGGSGSKKSAGGDDGNGDDKHPAATTAATGARFVSDRKLQESGDALATATLETETEFDRDARAIRAAVLTNALDDRKRGGGSGPSTDGDGKAVYTGARNYSDHNAGFRRNLDAATAAAGGGKAAGSHGPLRASVHARMSVRFDYQPDICKDYKETGYCGYGDACKFLHDRGDHKAGWQIDREWEAKQKKEAEDKRKREAGIFDDDDDDGGGGKGGEGKDEDGLPFACLSCKRPWATGSAEERRDEVAADPVVTKCGHHFCEACALRNAASDPKCPACGKAHGGTFNVAREIARKLARSGRGG